MALHLNPGTFQVHFLGVWGQLLTSATPKNLRDAGNLLKCVFAMLCTVLLLEMKAAAIF